MKTIAVKEIESKIHVGLTNVASDRKKVSGHRDRNRAKFYKGVKTKSVVEMAKINKSYYMY